MIGDNSDRDLGLTDMDIETLSNYDTLTGDVTNDYRR